MIDLDQRARQAGAGLRAWDSGTPIPSASAVATKAVRRTRRHRAAAGTALLGAVAGIALMWGGLREDGDSVRTGSDTTATSDPVPPSTTVPGPTPSTTVVPGTTTPSTPVGPSEPGPAVQECTGEVGSVSYQVTLPEGWYVNEAQDGVPACWLFGPEPVEASLGPAEGDPTITSNAAVWFIQAYPPDAIPEGSFDQRMTDIANRADTVDSQRTTIDGLPAARFERMSTPGDGYPGGERYVSWHIDLGSVELDATTMTQAGPYDDTVATLDAIVHSLRFTGPVLLAG